jgi:hypothetical protein
VKTGSGSDWVGSSLFAEIQFLPAIAGSLGSQQSCNGTYNLLLCIINRHGLNHRQPANNTIESEVSLPIQPDEVDRVLRFSGASGIGIGIKQKADVGPWDESHDESHVTSHHSVLQIHIGQFVEGVAIEDYQFNIAPHGTLERLPRRPGIDEVQEHPNAGHRKSANVFVAAIDRPFRAPDPLLSFEDPVPCPLPYIGKSRDVVPEAKHPVAHSLLVKESAQVVDLRGLACTIDAGETDGSNLQRIVHSHCVFCYLRLAANQGWL